MLIKRFEKNFIEIHAPAKINLFLEVLGKRPDGFHNINSLMQTVSLFDRLKIDKIEEPECIVNISGQLSSIPIENNLITKAYNLFKSEFNLKSGIKVDLDKNIPIAAGLGGGSSDCAATMIAINKIFNLRLTSPELVSISLRLGSDIPFFFGRGQAFVSGRGEICEETEFPVDYKIIMVSPGISVSTAKSYEALNLNLTTTKSPFTLDSRCGLEVFFESLIRVSNDFEAVQFLLYPELETIREELLHCGARLAKMSGSGPTMFGLFEKNWESSRVCRGNFSHCHLYTVSPFLLPEQENPQL